MAYDAFHGGSGPRVVLLHSGFSTWVEWRRTIDVLAEDHEVLAPTLPGSAGGPPLDPRAGSMLDSLAGHVETLLDEVGWAGPVSVVGSSYGGVVGLELLARERAARVLALAPPWVTGAGLPVYAALFGSVLPAVRLSRPIWRWSTRNDTINALWFSQSASRTPPEIDPDDVAAQLDSWSRFPFFRVGLHGRGGPGVPDLGALDASRVTLVWGGADRLVPRWMRERWEAALPGAAVVRLPGFPHQPHLRDPRRVASLVRDWAST